LIEIKFYKLHVFADKDLGALAAALDGLDVLEEHPLLSRDAPVQHAHLPSTTPVTTTGVPRS
jgi:hypothetical protein